MVRFHENLDDIKYHADTLIYLINNPTKEYEDSFTIWAEMIIEEIDQLQMYKDQMTNNFGRIADPEKLEEELQKFYGEDSDGTYKDFTIPS